MKESDLSHSKLPLKSDALRLFFHFHKNKKYTIMKSASLTLEIIMHIWDKSQIPMKEKRNSVEILICLHKKWVNLRKEKNRSNLININRRLLFKKELENIFDIAHSQAIDTIKIVEDREFLMAHREESRRGYIGILDKKATARVKRKLERQQIFQKREKKVNIKKNKSSIRRIVYYDSDDSTISEKDENYEPPKQNKKVKEDIINEEIVSNLERSQSSLNSAMRIIASTSKTLGRNLANVNISRSTISRLRKKHRKNLADHIKEKFKPTHPLTLHWDSKLLPTITGSKTFYFLKLTL